LLHSSEDRPSFFKAYTLSSWVTDLEVSFTLYPLHFTSWMSDSFQIAINGIVGYEGSGYNGQTQTVSFSVSLFCRTKELDVAIYGNTFGMRNFVIKGGNRCSGSCSCCFPES